MPPVCDPKRLFEPAAGLIRFQTCIQFIQEAILGSQDLLARDFPHALKRRFHDFGPVALIKTPGKFIENIGAEIQSLFGIREMIANNASSPAGVFVKPDTQELLEDLAFDPVQKAYGEKPDRGGQV